MMILGQPWHFWAVALGTAALLYMLDRRVQSKKEEAQEARMAEEERKKVKMFGGPLNGKEDVVEEQLDYFIVPYMPDEPDESKQIGVIGDKVLYAPNFAFYQQVGEPEFYFHRRDLTHEEFVVYNQSGQLPEDLNT